MMIMMTMMMMTIFSAPFTYTVGYIRIMVHYYIVKELIKS